MWNESDAEKLEENVSQVFLEEFPDLRQLHVMPQDFLAIIREKKTLSHLIDWIKTYKDISFSTMQKFTKYVEKDITAITETCTHPFSNGGMSIVSKQSSE